MDRRIGNLLLQSEPLGNLYVRYAADGEGVLIQAADLEQVEMAIRRHREEIAAATCARLQEVLSRPSNAGIAPGEIPDGYVAALERQMKEPGLVVPRRFRLFLTAEMAPKEILVNRDHVVMVTNEPSVMQLVTVKGMIFVTGPGTFEDIQRWVMGA